MPMTTVFHHSFRTRLWPVTGLAVLLAAAPAQANKPASASGTLPPPALLAPIKEGDRKVQSGSVQAWPTPGTVALASPFPAASAPAQAVSTRDPFEVSPQLKAGRSNRIAGMSNPQSGLSGANSLDIQRRIQVRAVIRTQQGSIAQLVVNNKDVLTVMEHELIDLADLGFFKVEIRGGAVSLLNPASPQATRVILR